MKHCIRCNSTMRGMKIADICKTCASVCPCGKRKDYRATVCVSCSSRAKGIAQWKRPGHKEWMSAKLSAVPRKHRTYEDLQSEDFAPRRQDGRWVATYHDTDGKVRVIYRNKWMWQQANGPVPKGMQIHHDNHDRTDDRLENLICMTVTEHRMHHVDEFIGKALAARGLVRTGIPQWTCHQCGQEFKARKRDGADRKYCSLPCRNLAYVKH